MKPLLRAVLVADAAIYLGAGAVLLLTPWAALQHALQLVAIEPAMAGQLLGLAFVGLAWLSLRGAIDGAMTVGVAKIVGHVTWLAGALVLVWLVAFRTSWAPALGTLPNAAIGVLLLIVGLGGARLAAAVRRREAAKALEARAAKTRADAPNGTRTLPVEPTLRPAEPAAAAPASSASAPVAQTWTSARRDEARMANPTGAPRPPFHG